MDELEPMTKPDADAFGRAIPKGIGINLLVRDVPRAVRFALDVLGATRVYSDEDFAILTRDDAMWMLHADRTYRDHPLSGVVQGAETRGGGAELRVYGLDPDVAEAKAEERGDIVLAGSMDKPHGLRECYLIDPEGYVWVPSVPKSAHA